MSGPPLNQSSHCKIFFSQPRCLSRQVESGHFFTYLWALEGTAQGDELRSTLQLSWEAYLGSLKNDRMWCEKCDRTSGWISFWEVCGLMSKYDVSWGDLHKLMDVSRNWKATHGEIMVKNEPWPCINAASHKPLRFWGEPLTKSQGQGLWMVCLYGFEWSDSCIEREREMIVIV